MMETKQIISWLCDKADRAENPSWTRMMHLAADRLKELDQAMQNVTQDVTQNVVTNADRIRAMSDEELAEFLCGVYDDDDCGVYQDEWGKFINGTTIIDYDQYKIMEWLQQPAKEADKQ